MNKIIIDGTINGGLRKKISRITNRPYINFTLLVHPEEQPPFYCRCYASGSALVYKIEALNLGVPVRVEGHIETTVLADDTYGKQINISEINIL